MDDKPYLCSSTHTFLDVLHASDFDEQSLFCELFLHNIICEHVSVQIIVTIFSYMGDLQLRAFVSFMRNQIEWHLAIKSMETNEEKTALWVRAEPGQAAKLRREFKRMLSTLGIKESVATYRRRIVNFCLIQFSMMKS